MLIAIILFIPFFGWTQPGISEMESARDDLTRSFFSSVDLSLVLAALFGLIGAIKIYHNWQMGKHHITEDVSAWFYAALFMVLMGPFVRALFGI